MYPVPQCLKRWLKGQKLHIMDPLQGYQVQLLWGFGRGIFSGNVLWAWRGDRFCFSTCVRALNRMRVGLRVLSRDPWPFVPQSHTDVAREEQTPLCPLSVPMGLDPLVTFSMVWGITCWRKMHCWMQFYREATVKYDSLLTCCCLPLCASFQSPPTFRLFSLSRTTWILMKLKI